MAAPGEAEGTFTNLERRVQRMKAILPSRGDAKAGWRVFEELVLRLRPEQPMFSPKEILARISAEIPAFEGVSHESIGAEGFVLGSRAPAQEPMPELTQVQG